MFGLNDNEMDIRRLERKLDILLDHFGLTPEAPPWVEEVERLVSEGRSIEAIRRVRKATGRGLKSAKAIVDDVARGVRPPF